MQIGPTDNDYCRPWHVPVDCRTSSIEPAEYGKRMTEPWTSVDEIARHLGVAKDSIYRWIDRRSLPAHRIGRLWKFKVTEVDEWVRAGGADSQRRNASKT